MRLCLNCKYLAPREALFCPHCTRSFGGRRCPEGHLSPGAAVCCQRCGKDQLSEEAPSLNLGFLPMLLSGLLVIAGVGLAAALWRARGGLLLAAAGTAATRAAASVVPPVPVWRPVAERALGAVIFWTAVLYLLPGRFGRDVRAGVGRLLGSVGRSIGRILGEGIRLLVRIVQGMTSARSEERSRKGR